MNVNQQRPHQPETPVAAPAGRRRRFDTRRAACGLAALALAGCSAVPLSSLWALRQLDFWNLDPTQIHAMALLPAGVGARPDALRLTLKAQRGGGSAEELEEHLALRAAAVEQAAPEQAAPGTHWLPLAFDETEVARFNAFRGRLEAWKAADGKVADRRFSLAVEPALCSTVAGGVETRKVIVSAWLRWKAGQEPVQVLDRAGLKDIAEKIKTGPRLPACA
ncbi:MAG TPA: hypothetical protein VLA16_23675 [Ideonella sp.]|nr:hypothetical protein [Ideonella sp.]